CKITQCSIYLTKKATDIGVVGVMLVAPYYNKPSQQGIYEHFKKFAEATPLAVILYYVPWRTGVQIVADTTIALSKVK
ncbi:dihydrodipicolinate synthase family protein, partial [Halalkalibacter lacteus]|uniref:dihydrodipicolinate synthase family protein n=1 Tax=Halalkalibacter lacteus TaxID=3090663 RepID=UPI002FC708BD